MDIDSVINLVTNKRVSSSKWTLVLYKVFEKVSQSLSYICWLKTLWAETWSIFDEPTTLTKLNTY